MSSYEKRDNGDLVLFASNGDPLVKLEAAGAFLMVNTNPLGRDHPLDIVGTVSIVLEKVS